MMNFYPKEMQAKMDQVSIDDLGPGRVHVTLCCETGHEPGFWVAADRSAGCFDTGESVCRVSLDSYAYRNGGCCYRAAQDAMHNLDVYHDAD